MSDKWKKKDKNVQNCEVKEEVNSQEILEEDEKCDRGGESHAEEKVDESPAVEEERCCRCCCCDSDDDDDDDDDWDDDDWDDDDDDLQNHRHFPRRLIVNIREQSQGQNRRGRKV